jgi:hypothetical protein
VVQVKRIERIGRTDCLRNYVLQGVKEGMNSLHTIRKRKANWIGQTLRRNCVLKHVIEGKIMGRIEVTGRHGRRHKQLLDDFKETREYWKLKEEAQDRTVWSICFGRGCGPYVRHAARWTF